MLGRFFDNTLVQVFAQLTTMSPVLAVYAVGMFLGFASLQKHRRSAVLLISGLLVLLGTSVVSPFVSLAVIEAHRNPQGAGPTGAALPSLLQAIGLLRSLFHAVGMGLVIAAALVDRRYEPASTD